MGQFIISVSKKSQLAPDARLYRRQLNLRNTRRVVTSCGKPMVQCPACGVPVKRLAKHRKKCPKRPHAPVPTVQSDTAVGGNEAAGRGCLTALQKRYARLVEEYNGECERLSLVRAEIDRLATEIQAMQPVTDGRLERGDRIRITSGPFENFEGAGIESGGPGGLIRVSLNIFGRDTHLDVEPDQVSRLC
jgi:hypothetical protein